MSRLAGHSEDSLSELSHAGDSANRPAGACLHSRCGQITLSLAWALLCREGPATSPHQRNHFFSQLGSLWQVFCFKEGTCPRTFQTVSFILLSPRGTPGGWRGVGRDEPWPHSLFWMHFGEKIQLEGEGVGDLHCGAIKTLKPGRNSPPKVTQRTKRAPTAQCPVPELLPILFPGPQSEESDPPLWEYPSFIRISS